MFLEIAQFSVSFWFVSQLWRHPCVDDLFPYHTSTHLQNSTFTTLYCFITSSNYVTAFSRSWYCRHRMQILDQLLTQFLDSCDASLIRNACGWGRLIWTVSRLAAVVSGAKPSLLQTDAAGPNSCHGFWSMGATTCCQLTRWNSSTNYLRHCYLIRQNTTSILHFW